MHKIIGSRLLPFLILSFSVLVLSSAARETELPVPFEYPLAADLSLTEEEILWLETHEEIRIAGPAQFPPFHFYSDSGEPMGITVDYLLHMAEALELSISYREKLPWPEVLTGIESKEIDLIACTARDASRTGYMLFTDPVLSFPLVILSRDDSPFIGGLEDLYGLRVTAVEKNVVSTWLKEDGIEIVPVPVKTPLEALEALSRGEAEAHIENLAAASYLINSQGFTNIKIAAPTKYGNYNLHMGVRDDWPLFVSIVNKWLAALSPQQHSRIRNSWLSITYEYGISRADIWRTVILAAVVFGLILSVVLLWNRRLKKEITVRKAAEEEREKVIRELKEAVENINTLKGLLPICASCKKIRDDEGYWEQIENYFEKHSELLFSHSLCPQCHKELYSGESWYRAPLGESADDDSGEPVT